MKKRFEGVFDRYEKDPTPTTAFYVLKESKRLGFPVKEEEIPKHELVNSSGHAYFTMADIAAAAPSFTSREEGAGISFNLKTEPDAIRLTVEVETQNPVVMATAEKEIERLIKNRYGKFTDISSAMSKK